MLPMFVNRVVWSVWVGLHADIIEYFNVMTAFYYTSIWSYCSFSISHHIGFFFIH